MTSPRPPEKMLPEVWDANVSTLRRLAHRYRDTEKRDRGLDDFDGGFYASEQRAILRSIKPCADRLREGRRA